MRTQKQQFLKQTCARSLTIGRFIFLREGFSHLCKKRSQTPRRDILAEANDWTVEADIEKMRYSHVRKWQEAGHGTRVAVILLELTVPWKERLEYSNALNEIKYADLSMDLEAKGYRSDLSSIEVGAREDKRAHCLLQPHSGSGK